MRFRNYLFFGALVSLSGVFFHVSLGQSSPPTPNIPEVHAASTSPAPTTSAAKTEESTTAIIAIAGDVMFEAELAHNIRVNNFDPFVYIQRTWDSYDFRVINLETNLSTPGKHKPAEKNFNFNAPLEALPALAKHVDMVSLANNHAMDYTASGLVEQMELLTNHGIDYTGAGKNLDDAYRLHIADVKGTKVAIIGLNDVETRIASARDTYAGTAPFDENRVRGALTKAKSAADIVIVFPHWGVEHVPTPNERQKEWAHKFVDWGADLVVGAHPHVFQTVETYKGKQIYYSLGNFIFVGMWDRPEAMKGKYLEVDIENKQIKDARLREYHLNKYGAPDF